MELIETGIWKYAQLETPKYDWINDLMWWVTYWIFISHINGGVSDC